MTELVLQSNMRVGMFGRTGSGKTVLAKALLEDQPRVIVVDDKHMVNFPGYYMTKDPKAALLKPKVIYRPEGKVPNSFWEDALTTLHDAGGGIIYIDELAEESSPNYMADGLKTLFRLGRELGVGVWYAAQSATEVFNTAIRQSDILVLFLNVGASDRDKIIKTAGDIGEVTAHLDLYDFVVFESADQSYDPENIQAYRLNL